MLNLLEEERTKEGCEKEGKMSKTNSKRVWTAMDEANTDNTASVVDMYLPSLPPAQNQAIQDVIESMLEDFLFEEVIEVRLL